MNRRDELRPQLLTQLLGVEHDEAMAIIAALNRVRHLPGVVCEFGVAQGYTSALIANEIRDEGTVLHLFDSFCGLPAPAPQDELLDDIFKLGSIEKYAGQMACARPLVEGRLREVDFPGERVAIHEGFVADTLAATAELPIAVKFAFVDLDFYEGTRDALAWLGQVAVVGAEIIVDDYGFFSKGAKTAVDEFMGRGDPSWEFTEGRFFAMLRRVA